MKNLIDLNKKDIIKISVILFVLVVLFMFIYLPQHQKVNRIKKQIEIMQEQIDLTKNMLGDLSQLGFVLGQMQQEMFSFEKRLPEKKHISSILSELSNLTKQSKVEVVSLNPERPTHITNDNGEVVKIDQNALSSFRINMDIKGSYKELADYLKRVQESLNIFAAIDEISISRADDIYPKLNAKFTLTMYLIDKA